MPEVWFWQRILSPHMAGLAAELASAGCRVTYVAEKPMSPDRAALGWQLPDLAEAQLVLAEDRAAVAALVAGAGGGSIHICQGVRANGRVGMAQRLLARRGLRQWVVMETVDDAGPMGLLKRLIYSSLFLLRRNWFEGVLATGYKTVDWVAARGMLLDRVFPFAYFLPNLANDPHGAVGGGLEGCFRFIFVGQLIELKRVGLLITALARLDSCMFELAVVGNGPLDSELRDMADILLPGRVRWLGRLPSTDVPSVMKHADCLVLPSRHDGWGAVVSEALMAGTPAICSDACGSAGVVRASGVGGVFPSGDVEALTELLRKALGEGRVDAARRNRLSIWGRCLGAETGASYLLDIFNYCDGSASKPYAPWASAASPQSYALTPPMQRMKS